MLRRGYTAHPGAPAAGCIIDEGPAQGWAGLGCAGSVSGEEARAVGPLPLRFFSRVLAPGLAVGARLPASARSDR